MVVRFPRDEVRLSDETQQHPGMCCGAEVRATTLQPLAGTLIMDGLLGSSTRRALRRWTVFSCAATGGGDFSLRARWRGARMVT